MAYPVQWLDQTFPSRSKAEALLRPDLESGLINQHDYNLATTFLPGFHRYWPVRVPPQSAPFSPSVLTIDFRYCTAALQQQV